MPLTTLKATTRKLNGGLAVESDARGFKVTMDEPAELGGTNKGMNPMELILCGLGGCQTIVASVYAESCGVDLKGFWVEIEGELDTDGFMGLSDVRPGYQEIRYKMHVKSDSPEEKIQEFVKTIESKCPVGDTLANKVKFVSTGVVIEK